VRPLFFPFGHAGLGKINTTEALAIEKRIEKIKQERSSYIPLLNFFQKVLSAQIGSSPHITIDEDDVGVDLARTKIEEGFPLLSKEQIRVDEESARQLFLILCQIAEKENRELEDAVKKIREALHDKKMHFHELVEWWVRGKGPFNPEPDSLHLPLLSLLLQYSVQPSLQAVASRLKDLVNEELWTRGYCPICGSFPFIAEMRGEGGERIFHCPSCSHAWKGRRLFCPFCENTEAQSLRYLYLEKESEYRIDLCDQCKRYIKTIDARKLDPPVIPALEDIATLHLDILAEENGFQSVNSMRKLFTDHTPSRQKGVKRRKP